MKAMDYLLENIIAPLLVAILSSIIIKLLSKKDKITNSKSDDKKENAEINVF